VTDPTEPEPDEEPFEPLYDNLTDWVEHHFAQTYAWKPGSSTRWCASWWDHPEAIIRLNVLWQLWEGARAENDPAEMGAWIRDWLDRLLPPMLSDSGPFARCNTDITAQSNNGTHTPPAALPVLEPPAEKRP